MAACCRSGAGVHCSNHSGEDGSWNVNVLSGLAAAQKKRYGSVSGSETVGVHLINAASLLFSCWSA